MKDIVVIGAGVAGLTTAAACVARGLSVRVVDRAPGLGPDMCSWWAGGMLAPWCERESAEERVVEEGAAAADWWEAHGATVVREGTLVVANPRDRSELQRFGRRTSNFERIDGARIAELEPALEGRFGAALYFAEEAHLAPRQTLEALVAWLRAHGVSVDFGIDGDDLAALGPHGLLIDCRGLAADLPELRGVKGEMLILRSREVELTRTVRFLHPRHSIYLVPRGDGVFMLGATMIESADRARVTARSMLELLGAAYALHPGFAEAEVLEIGVDARPAFSDNLPRIVWRDGRLHANGLFRHGFLLSPTLATMAAAAAASALEKRA